MSVPLAQAAEQRSFPEAGSAPFAIVAARALPSGAIRDRVRLLNLEVHCGLHTGERELVGNDLAGIAVHIGARVAALAAPSEVLVSQTVRDLLAGAGLAFEERGTHTLKGVPNEWRLLRAVLD
jgi:class 3 adenylate cyclase